MTRPDPLPKLDAVVQHPSKLAVTAFLSSCTEAEFKAVRDGLDLSDSALSKIVTALEAAGYVEVRKGYVGKRPRTWLTLTSTGRRNLAGHLSALQQIADQARGRGADLG
ncbi:MULTISPECIES: transcriptional regulator [unclassified Streptomyces]|uniref:transcriptional regulator n=1 Tax=unclassified Streptomyces TaxID=2593676 RepID=UPI002E1472A3|nr:MULTISPECIES: transcriptional regulator [unclassified Streptomyces]WSR29086.1 transcriptional regulator [Streptomyces sp. NBC_01205]